MVLTQEDIENLNKIAHTPGWESVLKLFKIYEDNVTCKITTSMLSNDGLRESIGELRVYKGLQTLVFSTYNRLHKTEEKV